MPLIFLVGERLGGGHGDRIARVDAHGIEILDRADDDDVVVGVAHHLHLEFLPADHRFFQQHLVDGRGLQAVGDQGVEFGPVVGDAGTGAAEGEAGPHHAGQTDLGDRAAGLVQVVDRLAAADLQPDPLHGRLELVALLGLGDDLGVGADHLDAVLLQHAVPRQLHGQVQPRLAAQGGQQGVGPLRLDHLGHDLPGERLDVGAVGHLRIGHDGGRVGVDQHHLVAFFPQGLAGLGAGIIELAGLADDDRTGTDQEDLVDIVTAWHGRFLSALLRPRASLKSLDFSTGVRGLQGAGKRPGGMRHDFPAGAEWLGRMRYGTKCSDWCATTRSDTPVAELRRCQARHGFDHQDGGRVAGFNRPRIGRQGLGEPPCATAVRGSWKRV